MLRHGVTTIEAKSGYGLDLPTELRLLAVAHELGREGPIDVLPTFLGAHAVPPEFRARPGGTEAYVRERHRGAAARRRGAGPGACHATCSASRACSPPTRAAASCQAAAGYGLAVRLHADELAPSGGAELAAELGALSADHLHVPSDEGIAALAAAADTDTPTVATLLPGTTWFLMAGDAAPARRFIDAGVPVALGTDFNPGTSPNPNLPLVMTVACLEMRLSPAEALAAVTVNAAYAAGIGDSAGSLEPGKLGDAVVWRARTVGEIPYWVGADLVEVVGEARPDRLPPRRLTPPAGRPRASGRG